MDALAPICGLSVATPDTKVRALRPPEPRSRVLYLGLLAYLASIYLRPAEIFPSWSAFPFVFAIAVVVAGLAVVSFVLSPRNPLSTPGDKFLLAYVAAILLSQPIHGWFGGLSKALSEFGPTVFAYLVLRLAVNTESQLIGVIRALTILLLVQAVNGIVQFHTGVGLGGISTVENGRIQGTGIFNDPNDLGLSLVMVVPYLISRVFYPRKSGNLRGIFWASALVAVLLAIYYTNSRGAALGLAVVVAAYCFLHLRRFFVSVAVALVLLGGLVEVAPSRASQISADEESTQGRVQAWYAGLSMFKAHPMFGIGFRGFTDEYQLVAHNSFVHVFAELGFTGGFCFVGLFYWYFRSLKRRAPPRTPDALSQLPVSRTAASRFKNDTPVSPDWFSRTLVPDVIVSGIGVFVCAFFLSSQYNIVLGVLLAIGATTGAIYRQQQPGGVPPRIKVTDLVGIATLSAGVLATISMLVRILD